MSQELTDIMTNKASKLTVGGLFSGIGGLELAFQNEGFKIAWANDIDKYTHQVYQRVVGSDHYIGNKPISLEYINEHFNEFDIQPVDVLTAGFPCQPFSNAGYREGFKDKKSLFPLRLSGHYNEEGYRGVSELLIKHLDLNK